MELKQDQEYTGKDRWKWSIWVTGAKQELDSIESVEYTLHPTFPNPVRVVTDRGSKFRLSASGWGTFTIYAKIRNTDGKEIDLEHELELSYPEVDSASSATRLHQKRIATIQESLQTSDAQDAASEARNRVLEKRIDEVLNNPRYKWRTLQRVAIEIGLSESAAADKLRASDNVSFGRGKKGETLVGLKEKIGDKDSGS